MKLASTLLFFSIAFLADGSFAQQSGMIPSRIPSGFSGGSQSGFQSSSSVSSSSQVQSFPNTSQSVSPDDYVVGPGDLLLVVIYSQTYTTYQLPVTPTGKVVIPRFKEIYVWGLSLDEVQKKLAKELTSVYRNADITVSLLNLRSFYVDVLGEVNLPSRLVVTAATRVSDALTGSPVLQTASLRQVQIKRIKPDTTYFLDLFRYYRLLDNRDNIFLRENDIILVSKRIKNIRISGEVKYPDNYEFLEGDSLYTLIKLAGGLIESAQQDSIEIIRFKDDQLSTFTIYLNIKGFQKESNIRLKEGDLVQIRKIPYYRPDETVFVSGRVLFPGYYRIDKNKTRLKDIIEKAGGFIDLASLEESSVIRSKAFRKQVDSLVLVGKDFEDEEFQYAQARRREVNGRMVADFKKLFQEKDLSQNILLEPGDVINVPLFKNYVNVIGQVFTPGNVEFREGKSIDYYIAAAGGFGYRAKKSDIMVLKPNTGDLISIDDIKKIEPSDVILVQQKPRPQFWTDLWNGFREVSLVLASIATTVFVVRSISK